MIKAILACDGQGGIARKGVMPWPRNMEDLRHFKHLTSGNTVVMGRRTWESKDMPSPLPGRTNIVVTRDPDYQADGATVIHDNINETLTNLAKDNNVFLIGGAELIKDTIDLIEVFHLSRISGHYECDTFLPLDLIKDKFECIDKVQIDPMTTFETYLKRK